MKIALFVILLFFIYLASLFVIVKIFSKSDIDKIDVWGCLIPIVSGFGAFVLGTCFIVGVLHYLP